MAERVHMVVWRIQVDAETSLEAATKAWAAMRNEDSIANVFEVTPLGGGTESIDLAAMTCWICGEQISIDQDGDWWSAQGLMCRGADPISLAMQEHVPNWPS